MTKETLAQANEIQEKIQRLFQEKADWDDYRPDPEDQGYGMSISYWRNNRDRRIVVPGYFLAEMKEIRLRQIDALIKEYEKELEAL